MKARQIKDLDPVQYKSLVRAANYVRETAEREQHASDKFKSADIKERREDRRRQRDGFKDNKNKQEAKTIKKAAKFSYCFLGKLSIKPESFFTPLEYEMFKHFQMWVQTTRPELFDNVRGAYWVRAIYRALFGDVLSVRMQRKTFGRRLYPIITLDDFIRRFLEIYVPFRFTFWGPNSFSTTKAFRGLRLMDRQRHPVPINPDEFEEVYGRPLTDALFKKLCTVSTLVNISGRKHAEYFKLSRVVHNVGTIAGLTQGVAGGGKIVHVPGGRGGVITKTRSGITVSNSSQRRREARRKSKTTRRFTTMKIQSKYYAVYSLPIESELWPVTPLKHHFAGNNLWCWVCKKKNDVKVIKGVQLGSKYSCRHCDSWNYNHVSEVDQVFDDQWNPIPGRYHNSAIKELLAAKYTVTKNLHLPASQLNGNNGEATNGDDVIQQNAYVVLCNTKKCIRQTHYHQIKKGEPLPKPLDGAARRIAEKEKKLGMKEVKICYDQYCLETGVLHYHGAAMNTKEYCVEAPISNKVEVIEDADTINKTLERLAEEQIYVKKEEFVKEAKYTSTGRAEQKARTQAELNKVTPSKKSLSQPSEQAENKADNKTKVHGGSKPGPPELEPLPSEDSSFSMESKKVAEAVDGMGLGDVVVIKGDGWNKVGRNGKLVHKSLDIIDQSELTDDDRLEAFAASIKCHLINVVGDGYCYFRAISMCLHGNQDKFMEYFNNLIEIYRREGSNRADELLNHPWGGAEDCYALQEALQCNFAVWSSSAQRTQQTPYLPLRWEERPFVQLHGYNHTVRMIHHKNHFYALIDNRVKLPEVEPQPQSQDETESMTTLQLLFKEEEPSDASSVVSEISESECSNFTAKVQEIANAAPLFKKVEEKHVEFASAVEAFSAEASTDEPPRLPITKRTMKDVWPLLRKFIIKKAVSVVLLHAKHGKVPVLKDCGVWKVLKYIKEQVYREAWGATPVVKKVEAVSKPEFKLPDEELVEVKLFYNQDFADKSDSNGVMDWFRSMVYDKELSAGGPKSGVFNNTREVNANRLWLPGAWGAWFGLQPWESTAGKKLFSHTGLYAYTGDGLIWSALAQHLVNDKINTAVLLLGEGSNAVGGHQSMCRALLTATKLLDTRYLKIQWLPYLQNTIHYVINQLTFLQRPLLFAVTNTRGLPVAVSSVNSSRKTLAGEAMAEIGERKKPTTKIRGGAVTPLRKIPNHGHGVYNYGPCMLVPVEEWVDKEFVAHDRFLFLKGFTDKDLSFTSGVQIFDDPDKRTLFGPVMAHSCIIHKNTPASLRQAMRRHTAVKKPESPGFDELLRRNQRSYYARNQKRIKEVFSNMPNNYASTIEEDGVRLMIIPHNKRPLRKQFMTECTANGGVLCTDWCRELYGQEVWCVHKLKRSELAKFGKYGRIIVDLGVGRSMQGSIWCDISKQELSALKLEYKGYLIMFVKSPDPEVMDYVFNLAAEPSHKGLYVCFSDDSFFIYNNHGKISMYNLDVSGNDTSHTQAVFDSMYDSFNMPYELVNSYNGQIMLKIKIDNPHNNKIDKPEVAWLKPREPYLQSGSTLTTILNSYANMNIAINMADLDLDYHLEDNIIKAWTNIGYIPDIGRAEEVEDLQFLKHSPVRDTKGNYRSVINLGPLFRASGSCKGDLPGGAKNYVKNCADFHNAVLAGFSSNYDCALFNKLRRTDGSWLPKRAVINKAKEDYGQHFSGRATEIQFSIESYLYRYLRHDMGAWQHFLEQITTLKGKLQDYIFANELVDTVLCKDYGYNAAEEVELPFYVGEDYYQQIPLTTTKADEDPP